MLTPDTPLNTAHQHAATAEEHESAGFLIPAAEARLQAAEAFQAALERSAPESSARRTLQMLHADQLKAAKDLQRRIDKLRAEGKDPALSSRPAPSRAASSVGGGQADHGPAQIVNLGQMSLGQSQHHQQAMMSDSHIPVDESFMLLAGQRSDPGDAFNQFWSIMQGMLDNLSQPVAFATLPLNGEDTSNAYPPTPSPSTSAANIRPTNGNDENAEGDLVSRMSRRFGLGALGRSPSKPNVNSSKSAVLEEPDEFDEFSLDELSESFCVVGTDASAAGLKLENATLKANVDNLKARLATMERMLKVRKDQDQQLRDSIVMARREAHRAMASSTIGAPGAGSMATLQRNPQGDAFKMAGSPVLGPITGLSSGREAQYSKRIRELEEEVKGTNNELKAVKAENEKHKQIIANFKKKWDKLKESAKKKKEAKAQAESHNDAVHERIAEDPEAEQEQEEVGNV
ncbi:hypothetical protein BDV98DRAFT_556994 [Pterulicium gracile]|uniref:Uncharacterized protein n=1 Tax=Pterulicium gracile TaxID=1884261 RepID=A0A5C3R6U0_9AGAR|nr:hypothetical protein BDV98DRAFT_556994 [Pterula gracilis]